MDKRKLFRLVLIGAVGLNYSWSVGVRALFAGILLLFFLTFDHFERWPKLASVRWQTWAEIAAVGFVADILTTYYFLHYTSIQEGNTFVRLIMSYFSVTGGLVLSKLVFLVLVIIAGVRGGEHVQRRATLCFGAAFYVVVATWNIFVIGVFSLANALT